jgi:hypothetical protein
MIASATISSMHMIVRRPMRFIRDSYEDYLMQFPKSSSTGLIQAGGGKRGIHIVMAAHIATMASAVKMSSLSMIQSHARL